MSPFVIALRFYQHVMLVYSSASKEMVGRKEKTSRMQRFLLRHDMLRKSSSADGKTHQDLLHVVQEIVGHLKTLFSRLFIENKSAG